MHYPVHISSCKKNIELTEDCLKKYLFCFYLLRKQFKLELFLVTSRSLVKWCILEMLCPMFSFQAKIHRMRCKKLGTWIKHDLRLEQLLMLNPVEGKNNNTWELFFVTKKYIPSTFLYSDKYFWAFKSARYFWISVCFSVRKGFTLINFQQCNSCQKLPDCSSAQEHVLLCVKAGGFLLPLAERGIPAMIPRAFIPVTPHPKPCVCAVLTLHLVKQRVCLTGTLIS